ncbi:MAG: hypothetical protein HKN80_06175, partial [Acidimicrobiia bacterium]|nr:hypothetical protein [Acidimicrobiia bacterium]
MAAMIPRLRRLLRPLIPDRLIARVRPAPSPAGSLNVDVVVAAAEDREQWLEATPDTVRIVDPDAYGPGPDVSIQHPGKVDLHGADIVAVGARPLSTAEAAQLLAPLSDPEVVASVWGAASADGFLTGRLPKVQSDAIAVRRPAWDELGGMPPGDVNLAGLFTRLAQAGHHLAVVPRPGSPAPQLRVDPVRAVGAAVVLAAVPLHDVGGGFRGAQIAMELCRRGFHVTYVAQYTSGHSVDLGLRFIHPRLEEYRLDDFDPVAHVNRLETDLRLALVEIPSSPVWAVAHRLSRSGFRLAYDLIDDWSDDALGGWWYRPEVEDQFIAAADTLMASARLLVRNLQERSGGRPVAYVPNGVNQNMFAGVPTEVPGDIPGGVGPLLSYHGSL